MLTQVLAIHPLSMPDHCDHCDDFAHIALFIRCQCLIIGMIVIVMIMILSMPDHRDDDCDDCYCDDCK